MRTLTTLAFLLSALTAEAQTGPPTTEEIAKAKADCKAEVTQDCLFVLAIESALSVPDTTELILNDIAFAQATAGDRAGAERTLTLTTPGFLALTALGRDAEAAVALAAFAEKIGATISEAEPPKLGEIELEKVGQLLRADLADKALTTALAIPEDGHFIRDEALRLIVDHHLERQDFVAAETIAKKITPLDPLYASVAFSISGRVVDPRADALVAVVKARSASGDLMGAVRLTNGLIDPQTAILARLVLVEAYFKAGSNDKAKAQLDAILSDMKTMELTHIFGLAELCQSADLAYRYGETEIALQHANFAYKAYSSPTVRRGGESPPEKPSRIDYLHLATVLQLLGQTGKGSALYANAARPYEDGLFSTLASDHSAALLVSQIRLGDPAAQDTIRTLLAKDDPFWMNGLRTLQTASADLVKLGFLDQALAIADELAPRLQDDSFHLDGDDPTELYAAILAQDPRFAARILTDKLDPITRFKVSLSLARILAKAGQTETARGLLLDLADAHGARTDSRESALCIYRSIAVVQEDLGLPDDAAQSRMRGLALADQETDAVARVFDLLGLAASFGDPEAALLSFGLGCLIYH